MYRILIVEDDPAIAGVIAEKLESWGFSARIAGDLANVMDDFCAFDAQLVILDISLPFYNGYYWCGQIRKASRAPVMFLSSRTDQMDIVMAMNMGGDDYLVKPVSLDVLVAKVQALLRRAYDYAPDDAPRICGAALDAGALALISAGKRTELTRNEVRMLQLLLSHKGEVVSREQLMLALWDNDTFVDDNTLTVNINRLRKTLERAGLPECIVTHRNAGYAICE